MIRFTEKAALRVLRTTASACDRMVLRGVSLVRARGAAPSLPEARLARLERLIAMYEGVDAGSYFPEPQPIEPEARKVRDLGAGRAVYDLSWPSSHAVHCVEVADTYRSVSENGAASVRWFRSARARGTAVLIHGYMAGHYGFEERVWPLEWFDRLGLDVALFVLPFHGLRARAGETVPPFLSGDPRMAHEGFRQAVSDLRDFCSWLRRQGAPHVGLMGMSLGGYTAALSATVEDSFDFVVPIIPLASIPDFVRDFGALSGHAEWVRLQHAALERVYRLISPLDRPLCVARDRVLVVGAEADRVTPPEHARRLARHFSVPLITWPGGHLLQVGRRRAFERIEELLLRLDIASVATF